MDINFPKIEEKILDFWKKNQIFEKSIERRKKAKDFVFYEGPPTANGQPGIHHVLARIYKDIICRYKTMKGFRVLRTAGWDTHGLPVELEIEKKLGLGNKKDIEKYGVAEFNKKCKESVWQYKDEWEKMTERIGYWLDMEHPYITYKNEYIEKVWGVVKQIWRKGLLYKDYKVVPYCSRCGTSLSSHEVAQGYKKIKEPAIYIKFKITNPKFQDTFLLVWTTTPWTLPGNVAVAANPKFTYAKVKIGKEYLILSKERIKSVGAEGEVVEEFKGNDLIGLRYQPFYPVGDAIADIYKVIAGDFVSLEEGTGLVHIAPAFGEDDMRVGKENNLPVILNVDEEGKFKPEVKDWAGMFVKDADPLIAKNLQERGLLFKEEPYEHDYPFCWRCDSPLLYYAKESWFIRMQQVKNQLIKNAQKINWVPAHLKEGRFGEWLKEVKDWAISRERYWGTPLPIWQCEKCGCREVIGGKEDLLKQKFTNNKYFILRHGESLANVKELATCWPEKNHYPLTEKGEKQIKEVAKKLKGGKIDLIFSSDLLRTKQTAEIVGKELDVRIDLDKRLRDVGVGIFNGKSIKEVGEYWNRREKLSPIQHYSRRFEVAPPEGENYLEIEKRMYGFLNEINQKYQGKNILIVSHKRPLALLEKMVFGYDKEKFVSIIMAKKEISPGELREFDFKLLPYNEQMELDFHRPYIDEVKFQCPKCRGVITRVPELIDVWFDSGSMPFTSQVAGFPADYICEAIDQTRGWFYTLLAISTLLGRSAPYKNVVSTGHVLDEKGEKMSKSKGNVVNPWDIMEKYGADAARWYFYTVNQPGDPKLFSEKDIDQALKRFILTLWNSFLFFDTYKQENYKLQNPKPQNILDKWVLSRLNGLIQDVTEKLDKYDVTGSARAAEDFVINDLSLWYIRRSRKRFEEAAPTLHFVLLTLTKLTAPFIPFLSEEIYGKLTEVRPQSSVHLADWPKADKKTINKKLETEMTQARGIVSLALAERAKTKMKVRQPLLRFEFPESQITARISSGTLEMIKEEINVKEIIFGKELKLDTTITRDLEEEGIVRETIRQIQEMRKKAGLKPQDKIAIEYAGTSELNETLEKNKAFILKETKAEDLNSVAKSKVEQKDLWLEIKKL